MKKRIVCTTLLVTLVTMGALTGCGSKTSMENADVAKNTIETEVDLTVWADETLIEAKEMCVMEGSVSEVEDADITLPVLMEDEVVEETIADGLDLEKMDMIKNEEMNLTEKENNETESERYTESDICNLKMVLEEKLDPVKCVLEDTWMDTLQLAEETRNIVQAVAVSISEKSTVEVVNVNLEENTVTYEVTSPDLKTYVKDMVSRMKAEEVEMEDIFCSILTYLDNEDILVTTEKVTVPVEKDGNYWYLKMKNADLVEQVTGGFYDFVELLQNNK